MKRLTLQKQIDALTRRVDDIAPVAALAPSAAELAGGYRVLPDGTKQFGFAPSGTHPDGSTINQVVNVMPVPGPEWGIGAVVRQANLPSQQPHTVVALAGDWGVRATGFDGHGQPSTIELPIDQLVLVKAAA